MNQFLCGDVVPGCDMAFRGLGEEGILERAMEHATEVHGIASDADLHSKVRGAITAL